MLWNAAALAATAVSDNAYDTGAQPVAGSIFNDLSRGEPLVFAIAVIVAADLTTGDETYEFDIINDSASNLTTAPNTLAKYVIPAANLTLGTLLALPMPIRTGTPQRYLGLKAVLGGTTPSITVTAWITSMNMIDTYRAFASKIVVL